MIVAILDLLWMKMTMVNSGLKGLRVSLKMIVVCVTIRWTADTTLWMFGDDIVVYIIL